MEKSISLTESKKLFRQGVAVFLITTILFVALYFPCIFQDKMYVYQDIGRDTQNQYLPNMVYALRSFKTGEVDEYRLDRGLGEYYPSQLYKYINVVNIPILLFGEDHLAWGLLAATYLKYLVIALFSWSFFRHLLGEKVISVCCALLWTYCGYAVIWGQHYHLLTSICAFTVEIYGLQLFLESDKKAFLFIPAVACMAYTGYFYLWMGTFFVLGYSVLYMVFHRESFVAILKKAGLCALSFIWAFFIAGEYMFPAVEEFLESTRGSGLASTGGGTSIFYSQRYIFTFLARLLSNNLLGIANSYSGPTNYYEIAFLSVGLLFFFSICVLLQSKHTRRKSLTLIVLCGLLICMPITSTIISLRSTTQRWTFVILLAEVIGIGFGLKELFRTENLETFRRTALNALLLMDILCCALILAVWVNKDAMNYTVLIDELILIFVVLAVYNILLLALFQVFPNWSYSFADFKRVAMYAIMFLACLEIVVLNYPAINTRMMPTRSQWQQGLYYDGTAKAAEWIKSRDDGIYRVSKTYESVSRNDELIQNYNGVAVYNSLNSQWLVNYYNNMGYGVSNTDTNTGSSFIRFVTQDEAEVDLLGDKYIITKKSLDDEMPLDMLGFYCYHKDRKTGLVVYRNDVVSSFGYFYDSQVDYDDIRDYGNEYGKLVMTRSYFDTVDLISSRDGDDEEEIIEEDDEVYVEEDIFDAPLFNDPDVGFYTRELINQPVMDMLCDIEDIDIPAKNELLRFTLTTFATKATPMKIYYAGEDKDYTEQRKSSVTHVGVGRHEYTFAINNIKDIRNIRFSSDEPVRIESAVLEYVDRQVVYENLRQLYDNGEVRFEQEGNYFNGWVNNPGESSRMLCVPIIYNQRWKAKLDGADIRIRNINGGLIGIEVEPGEHTVQLTYRDPLPVLGRLVGASSFALYLEAALLLYIYRRRRRNTGIAARSNA